LIAYPLIGYQLNGMTERQEQILDFVRGYQEREGVPPSTREVARQFECSQPTALQHLQALAKKEQLEKLADGKWGLKASAVQGHLFAVPVYGTIPAGLPSLKEQNPDETVAINPALFGLTRTRPGQLWALQVQGDSMIDAGILEGDLALMIKREPKPGDIIAALVDGTASTLKRLVQVRGRLVLRAENKRYHDIIPERLEAQGVLVGVIRRSIQ
jgi:repressor LexA